MISLEAVQTSRRRSRVYYNDKCSNARTVEII